VVAFVGCRRFSQNDISGNQNIDKVITIHANWLEVRLVNIE
jgi:hypothetical protein